jgi:glycosyltransferase involved in cell wall biosynthesis
MNQHLIYLSSFEYPSTHGHPLHALSMARAFALHLENRFLFVVGGGVRHASLAGIQHASPFGLGFSLLKLFHLRSLGYAGWLAWFLARNREWKTNLTVFTNDLRLASVAGLLKPFFKFSLICEVHGSSGIVSDTLALSFADRRIFVTTGLRDRYTSLGKKELVLPNAVDLEGFANASAGAIRKELQIPSKSTVIGYVGRFHPMTSDKGTGFLIDSLGKLPQDVCVLLVGGTSKEILEAKHRAQQAGTLDRLFLVPLVPFDKRYEYFLAADILAYVPQKEDRFLREETSPMKLFEYMAAKRPIIASDLPAFREALGGDGAHFVPTGNMQAFLQAVDSIRKGDVASVLRAYERVSTNTWEARAKRVLTFS